MKVRNFEAFYLGLAVIATIFSLFGLAIPTAAKLGINSKLAWSLVGLLVAFAIGLASARLTASLRHLGKSRKVFLSYSRSERELARRITSGLQAAGIKVWIDEEHLLPGAALIPAVDSAMSEADSVVAILSQSPGPVVVHEIQRARASGTPVIPVLSHASDMPDLVAGFQYVDFSDFKQGMSRLINAVQQARRAPDSEPQEDA